jgi:hypothetical protein
MSSTPFPGLRLALALEPQLALIQRQYDAAREAVADLQAAATGGELTPEQEAEVRAKLEQADIALVEAGLAAGASVPEIHDETASAGR